MLTLEVHHHALNATRRYQKKTKTVTSTRLEEPLVSNGHSQFRAEAEGLRSGWCVHSWFYVNIIRLFTVGPLNSRTFTKTLKAKILKVVLA